MSQKQKIETFSDRNQAQKTQNQFHSKQNFCRENKAENKVFGTERNVT